MVSVLMLKLKIKYDTISKSYMIHIRITDQKFKATAFKLKK